MIHELVGEPPWTIDYNNGIWLTVQLEGASLRYPVPTDRVRNVQLVLRFEEYDAQSIDPNAPVR